MTTPPAPYLTTGALLGGTLGVDSCFLFSCRSLTRAWKAKKVDAYDRHC
ncbi:MAG: hypothetical protein K0R62_5444 [Nonomuraea muscovyensis]|nr:hypothetical protein [Nonomuraea muscovyensis]